MSADTQNHSTPAGLRGKVVRGVSWMVAGQIATQIVLLGTTVVIARLLKPRDYGLAGEALVFSRFAFLMTDLALTAALVQRKELSEEDRHTAFWTTAAVGVGLGLAAVGLAGPIADLYRQPRVEPLVAVLSLSVLFTAVGLTPAALLTRDLRFRSIQLCLIATTLVACAAAIVVAVLGYGPWAIITQSLAMTGVSTALMWAILGWRPRFVYSRKSLRGFAAYSGYVFGSGLISYLYRNADNFLIGRFLGPAKLGGYSLAYGVMLVPSRTLSGPVQNVVFPAMSRIGDAKRVGEVWIRATRLVSAVTVPTYLGLMVVAPDLVPVVLGKRWNDAIPVLQILAYVGLLLSWGGVRSSVLLALDRTSILFRLSALGTGVALVSFGIGLHWGIVGVAVGLAIATTAGSVYSTVVVGHTADVTYVQFLRTVSGVIQAGGSMALVVLGARLLLAHEGVSPAARLAIAILVGITVYLPVCAWRAPEVVSELRDIWRRRRAGEPAATVGPAPAA